MYLVPEPHGHGLFRLGPAMNVAYIDVLTGVEKLRGLSRRVDRSPGAAYSWSRMIFLVALGALAFGAILITLIARYAPDAANARLEEQRRKDEQAGKVLHPPIPFEEWRMLVIDLLEALGFTIALEHRTASEVDIIARSTEPLRAGRFIVHALHAVPGDVVDQTWVLRLQEAVRGESASKGILMTPYAIDSSGLGAIDANLELVDGKKLRELISRYLPKKLDAIEGYRGF